MPFITARRFGLKLETVSICPLLAMWLLHLLSGL
jgi:hypothetical protein